MYICLECAQPDGKYKVSAYKLVVVYGSSKKFKWFRCPHCNRRYRFLGGGLAQVLI